MRYPSTGEIKTACNKLKRNGADSRFDKKRAESKQGTQAQLLIGIATSDDVELFHTPDGIEFADIYVDGHRETWALKSAGFRRWIKRAFYKDTGGAPNSDAMARAMGIIEAKAHFDGEEREVHLRVANYDDRIYLDLCDPDWRSVEITNQGWAIVNEPPVRFRRKRGMQLIPDPVGGGEVKNLGGLRTYLNVDDDSFILVVAWLLAILRGAGPYPILGLTGEQGSGKTMLAEMLQRLVDPRTGGIRSLPKDARDLYIAAMNGQVLVFDNLSGISAELSDCLCRLSTGGGFATRSLYTDDDEVIFDGQRPIALTSINDVASRSDLADRAMLVNLETIPDDKRRPEKYIYAEFDKARPFILGALLDVVAHGLFKLPTTSMNRLPRMADFALWVRACEEAVWSAGSFIGAYDINRDQAVDVVLDSDQVTMALRQYLQDRWGFEGTATELLNALDAAVGERARRSKSWPRSPAALSGRVKRMAPALRKVGITVEFMRQAHTGRRLITITEEGKGGRFDVRLQD